MTTTIVAAVGRGGAIGSGGTLPWRFPEDLAHFKALTAGGSVIMGRRTYDSLPDKFRPLPDRANFVLTRSSAEFIWREGPRAWKRQSIETLLFVSDSLETAIATARNLDAAGPEPRPVFVIGGAEVYAAALPLADAMEITEVDVDVEGADARFPFACFGPQRVGFARSEREPTREIRRDVGERLLLPADCGEFRCVSRRSGDTPELTFVRWERVR